jgi:hypothetical protein
VNLPTQPLLSVKPFWDSEFAQMHKNYCLAVVAHGQPYDSRGTPMGYLFGEGEDGSPAVGAEAFSFWEKTGLG